MRSFDDLYREYAPAVYRVVMRSVGRPEIAEEITSETFLSLFRQYDSLQDDDSQFPAWLFTVAKRRAIDYWRSQIHEKNLTFAEPVTPADESRVAVAELLHRTPGLKPIHRLCILLRYWHGMSRTEIAAQVGLDETQVKGYLQYALKLLKQQLANSRQD